MSATEMKHSDRIKLPNGMFVVPIPGAPAYGTKDMIFKPYYVRQMDKFTPINTHT
jgi:hypothetical protein